MPCCWRKILLALPLLAALPLAAIPNAPTAKQQPAAAPGQGAELALLRQQARAFLALPTEQRARMIQLDADLHRIANPGRQQHLLDVLRRYAVWLDFLPEHERRQVIAAPTRQERLRRIRVLRDEQWLLRQPKAVRDGLTAVKDVVASHLTLAPSVASAGLSLSGPLLAPGPWGRPFLMTRLRLQERRWRREWHIAVRHWEDLGKRPLPVRLTDFPAQIQNAGLERYVKEYLMPMLSAQERELLSQAEGALKFPYVLVYLADRHPLALPGRYGPNSFKELPSDVQKRIEKAAKAKGSKASPDLVLKKRLRTAEGNWPKFASEIVRVAGQALKGKGIRLSNFELWPARFAYLSPEVQKFVKDRLSPRLNEDEKTLLAKSEGKWPDYPQTIQDLATRYSLYVPWQTLPGPRRYWDFYRVWSGRRAD